MRILFEDYVYDTKDVADILGSFMLSELSKSKKTIYLKHVGYFFSKDIPNANKGKGDLVFILPKVLLDDNAKTAFGIEVEKYLNFSWKEWKGKEEKTQTGLSKDEIYRFVYGFSTWIYRAVDVYRHNLSLKQKNGNEWSETDDEPEKAETEVLTSLKVKSRGSRSEGTFMDVMLALLDFHRKNKNFILFVMKMAHSGFNKINWQKTISRSLPIIEEDTPIYMALQNKKKFVDFDEELLVLYYSILNYLHEEYGFAKVEQLGYDIIKGVKFRSLLNSVGKMRLRRIKNKYFSDKAVLLWNLCYAFFEHASELKCSSDRKDYLLISSFHCVFEAMIDELLGDKDLPQGLKKHSDDKRIDHLYTYRYLLENEKELNPTDRERDIYHIADSKYYRRDKKLNGHDVPKQFTYARNVIQWHMDLLNDILYSEFSEGTRRKKLEPAEEYKTIKLYDEITEGFNIIPNFFISAMVDDKLNYDFDNFGKTKLKDGKNLTESFHFWERLFDRDSLFTLHYDVNFLFILKLYAQNKSYGKSRWKLLVRDKFRESVLSHLNENYSFYQIMIDPSKIQQFVDANYRRLVGKVFCFDNSKGNKVLLYAERKGQNNHNGNGYKHDDEKHSHISEKDGVKRLTIPGYDDCYKVKNIILGTDGFEQSSEDVTKVQCEVPVMQISTSNSVVPEADSENNIELNDVEESKKYKEYLPLYDIKVACGALHEEGVQCLRDNVAIKCWRKVSNLGFSVTENMFIVEAKGESMLPEINPGDLCIFELYGTGNGGSREGQIVLATSPGPDSDYSCRYTIKKYHSEKNIYPDGGWEHTIIELIPLNDEYETISILPEDTDFRILAIYKGKL